MPIIVLIIPAEATHRPYRRGEESRHPWVSQPPNTPLSVCLHRVRFTSVTRHWWWVSALRVRANNVWPGRAVQDGLPRSTNVRAASM